MAQHFFIDNNRRTSINDQVIKDNYDQELKQLMERERQFQAAHVEFV